MDRLASALLVEAQVLGGIMIDPDGLARIDGLVTAGDFQSSEHRQVFETIALLADKGKPTDPVTVGEALGKIHFTGRLAQDTASTANLEHYARAVRQKAQRKRLAEILERAVGETPSRDLAELAGDLQSQIEALLHEGKGEETAFREALMQANNAIQEAADRRAQYGIVGIPTGLPAIDRKTGGLQAPRLVVVAARPSVGKTALANQVALHAASRGHGVGICSLEMGREEIAIRAYAHRLQLNGTGLAFGDDDIVAEFSQNLCSSKLHELPIWIDDGTVTLGGIVGRLTEWRRKHDIGLAIVDHIGLVEVDGQTNRNEQLGKITRTLKQLCKRLGIPILAVSQLNRNVEKEKRRPELADLRDSGSIEQDCDIAIFLHAEADHEGEAEIPTEIGLLKNRTGRRGWLREQFVFDGQRQTFREVAHGDTNA